MTDHLSPDHEPRHAESSTASLLAELQLFGRRPFQDEPDTWPPPEERQVRTGLADIFDALVSALTDTRLGPDLEDLLWSTVNLFHRAADRVERELDRNEQAQRRSQKEQDGSEVRSVELERLLAEGTTLIERRNAFEVMRDGAAKLFETHTGSAWRPRAGSMVNHRALTSAMIDSRDSLAAKRRAETEVMLPSGPKIAFAGSYECNDHPAIWAALDRVRAEHPIRVGDPDARNPGRRLYPRSSFSSRIKLFKALERNRIDWSRGIPARVEIWFKLLAGLEASSACRSPSRPICVSVPLRLSRVASPAAPLRDCSTSARRR